MSRALLLGLILVFACGCERVRDTAERVKRDLRRVAGPGPAAAEAPGVVPDSFPTVTRRVLTGATAHALSAVTPDGTSLLTTDWQTGNLQVRNLSDGSVRDLTRNPYPFAEGLALFPVVSRDGSQVAFTWVALPGQELSIRTVPFAGGEVRELARENAGANWIMIHDWLPDGSALLASRAAAGADELFMLGRDGRAGPVLRGLQPNTATMNPLLSPDGRFIAFAAEGARGTGRAVFVLDRTTGREAQLDGYEGAQSVLGWSPDGNHLLFASDRTGSPGAWLQPMDAGRAAGPPVLVKPDMFRATPVGFTRNGRFFYAIETGSHNLYSVPFDPTALAARGDAAPVLPWAQRHITGFSYSPDGRALVYAFREGPPGAERRAFAIRSTTGGEERVHRLADFQRADAPHWARENELLFFGRRDNGPVMTFRMQPSTGRTDTMSAPPRSEGVFAFHRAAGDSLIMLANPQRNGKPTSRYRILVWDPVSGGSREIYALGSLDSTGGYRLSQLTRSSDGRMLAFVRSGPTTGSPPDSTLLMVVPAAGGEPRVLARGQVWSPVFTPDGKALLFATGEQDTEARVMSVSVDGGSPQPVGLTTRGLASIRLSPDGTALTFTAGEQAFEIWSMENFLPR